MISQTESRSIEALLDGVVKLYLHCTATLHMDSWGRLDALKKHGKFCRLLVKSVGIAERVLINPRQSTQKIYWRWLKMSPFKKTR
ncbi:hypothetical protein Lser_V15G16629 [Lactuca serriola]